MTGRGASVPRFAIERDRCQPRVPGKCRRSPELALQLPFLTISESMGNHDSKIVDAGSVG
jgi:hypothetical protein